MSSPHSKAYQYEKRIIEDVMGGVRVIDQSGGSPDGYSSWWVAEAFQRPIPQYVKDEFSQAEKARDYARIPIGIWKEKHMKDNDAFVFMRLSDFLDNFGKG